MDYSKLTDNEIVALAQESDQEAKEYILAKYKPLVKKIANNYFLFGGDNDDLIQEGMIGLFYAVLDFQPDKGYFSSFARLCISRSVCKAVTKANSEKNKALNESISIQETEEKNEDVEVFFSMSEIDSDINNPEVFVVGEENANDILKKINENLSPFEREVLKYHIAGYDYKYIAKKLDKTDKSIDNALNRIKNKVKKFF